jgi:hypothetical protein
VHCKTCDIKDPSQDINWVSSLLPARNGFTDSHLVDTTRW